MKNERNYEKKIELSYSDYKKVRKTIFPMYLKKTLIVLGIFMLLMLIDYVFEEKMHEHSLIETMVLGGLVFVILAYIIVLIINKLLLKFKYKKFINSFKVSFNDEYLKIDKDVYGYKSISNYYENDNIMYFFINKNILVFFNKEIEDEKLIDYIRLKITKEKEYVNLKTRYKKQLIILNTLFVLSIISLFFINVIPPIIARSQLPSELLKIYPNATFEILNIFRVNIDNYLIIDYYEWSLLLFIFPTALYVLAKRLKRLGIKCNLSIACAIITGIIMLFMTAGYFNYKTKINYNTFIDNQDIIGCEIPKDGMFFRVVEDKDILTAAYFKNEKDAEQFKNEIMNNNNWVTINDLDIELRDYLTNNGSVKDCYYSIYDEEAKHYDVPIRENGKHTIYSMSYNIKNNILMIFKFEIYV